MNYNKSFPSWERGLKHSPSLRIRIISLSFPSWERGLKPGVWLPPEPLSSLSFPSWERGLKQRSRSYTVKDYLVVPLVGTWIETYIDNVTIIYSSVVPLVGTWIETRSGKGTTKYNNRRYTSGNVD